MENLFVPVGLYISVPFCRTKCSYCNFASEVFSKAVFQRYVDRVSADVEAAAGTAKEMGGHLEREVDSIYLGGGTPTVLDGLHLERLFDVVRQSFVVLSESEITVECAPGTLTAPMIETLQRCGVNRVSLGVQSFVDAEAASVGRLHQRVTVLSDIARLRAAGVTNINIDLIAGLPHQTPESWNFSLDEIIASGAPHASVYMLEVDEDSRLGRELLAGGAKYHAHFVPDEEVTADLYEMACERLSLAGIKQYEISNFAQDGCKSRHNLKYWTRQPYLGFGVDAHSMLPQADAGAMRFFTPDSLEAYIAGAPPKRSFVDRQAALEETFFLGLRLNSGVDLEAVSANFGEDVVAQLSGTIAELISEGLVEKQASGIRLTSRGRLLSNEVFQRFLGRGQPARTRATKKTAGTNDHVIMQQHSP
jgi:oxygen-independent coproporphyrinogen-3 oxidase